MRSRAGTAAAPGTVVLKPNWMLWSKSRGMPPAARRQVAAIVTRTLTRSVFGFFAATAAGTTAAFPVANLRNGKLSASR